MKIAKNYKKFVYCLEGDWEVDLRNQSSINAALMFLQQNCGIKFIHRDCGTRENLEYYLSKWKQKKYADYSICYLAFHGKPELILIGKEKITLDELGDMLEGACKNKIIHFGSCSTLDTDTRIVKKFLEKTEALCVCGFKNDINFVPSSVFDMLLIEMFQDYKDISCVYRDMNLAYGNLVKELDFRLIHL